MERKVIGKRKDNMKSKIETVQNNYYNLLERINKARQEAYRNQISTKDIWLGPKEREILATHGLLEKEELSLRLPKHFPVLETTESLVLKLKGSTIYGMTIRFAEEDGIWAGINFSDNEV